MKILTGNDLKTGAVTWWTGSGWSLHVNDSVDVGADADSIIAAEQEKSKTDFKYTPSDKSSIYMALAAISAIRQ